MLVEKLKKLEASLKEASNKLFAAQAGEAKNAENKKAKAAERAEQICINKEFNEKLKATEMKQYHYVMGGPFKEKEDLERQLEQNPKDKTVRDKLQKCKRLLSVYKEVNNDKEVERLAEDLE